MPTFDLGRMFPEFITEDISRAFTDHRFGEDWVPFDENEYADLEPAELDEIINKLHSLAMALINVRDHAKVTLAEKIGVDGSYRIGPNIHRVKATSKLSNALTPKQMFDVFGERIVDLFPMPVRDMRKTALKAIAKERGVKFDTLWETLVEETDGPPKLETMPISKAPKYLQELEEGELRHGKRTNDES